MNKQLNRRIVFLAGSGRSGLAWVGDVLASCKGCHSSFEPMRRERVSQVASLYKTTNDLPGPYLRPDSESPEWTSFFDQLFAGRISNGWVREDWRRVPGWIERNGGILSRIAFRIAATRGQFANRGATGLIVKEVRANLLLAWLSRRYPLSICFMTRHPCAVVGSRLKMNWSHSLDGVRAQTNLLLDHLTPYLPIISGARSPIQQTAVLWCIENLVPLAKKEPSWIICNYESFCLHPRTTFDALIKRLGLQKTSDTEKQIANMINTPPDDDAGSYPWHHPLTACEGEEVLAICEGFGLRLYGRDPFPRRRVIETTAVADYML